MNEFQENEIVRYIGDDVEGLQFGNKVTFIDQFREVDAKIDTCVVRADFCDEEFYVLSNQLVSQAEYKADYQNYKFNEQMELVKIEVDKLNSYYNILNARLGEIEAANKAILEKLTQQEEINRKLTENQQSLLDLNTLTDEQKEQCKNTSSLEVQLNKFKKSVNNSGVSEFDYQFILDGEFLEISYSNMSKRHVKSISLNNTVSRTMERVREELHYYLNFKPRS